MAGLVAQAVSRLFSLTPPVVCRWRQEKMRSRISNCRKPSSFFWLLDTSVPVSRDCLPSTRQVPPPPPPHPPCVSFLPLKHVSWVTFYWDWQVICAVATNRMLIFYFAGMQETEWGGMKILLTCTGQCSRFINNLLLWSLDQAWQYSTV